jgi:hypothetical protein
MAFQTRNPPARPSRAIPDAPPANILIPPQQTVEAAEEEHIRTRAYELWEAAGRPEGDGAVFWYQAEQEFRNS